MISQNRCRTCRRNRIMERSLNGLPLRGTGNRTNQPLPREQRRNGQCHRLFRHIIKGCETTVIDLLLATCIVQLDHLDPNRIIKIGDRRIVERQMSVFANSETDQIYRRCFQQAFVVLLGFFRINQMNLTQWQPVEQPLLEKGGKTLRGSGTQPDVFVHVEGNDSLPIDPLGFTKGGEHFVLRRSGSKNRPNCLLFAESISQKISGCLCRRISHFEPCCKDFYVHTNYLYFPKFKLVSMRKIRTFQGWSIIMPVSLFGQSRIKIGGKNIKTANSEEFILPILT